MNYPDIDYLHNMRGRLNRLNEILPYFLMIDRFTRVK